MEFSRCRPNVDLFTIARLWYLDDIRELLSVANMSLMRNSCFGHLFDIGPLNFQGELLMLLCKRLHSNSLDLNTLLFKFGDRTVEFGRSEFCLLTGLKFSGSFILPNESEFHSTAFASRSTVFFGEIETEFRNECAISGGNSARSLKLAYAFIIYGLFLMNNPHNGRVELGYMHILDDLDKFNDFPWGHVAYEYLVKSTHMLKRQLSTLAHESGNVTFEAYGFVFALKCWAYEVIPPLATVCAELNIEHLASFPRMRRWSATSDLKSIGEGLTKFFLPDQGCDPVPMSLSSTEIIRLTELGISSPLVASPPSFNLSRSVGRKLEFSSVERCEPSSKNQPRKRKSSGLGSSPLSNPSTKSKAGVSSSMKKAKAPKKYMPQNKLKGKLGCYPNNGTPPSEGNSNANVLTPDNDTISRNGENNELRFLILSLKGQMKCLEEFMDLKFKMIEGSIDKLSFKAACSGSAKVGFVNGEVANGGAVVDEYVDVDASPQIHNPFAVKCEDVGASSSRAEVNNEDLKGGQVAHDPNDLDLSYTELKPYLAWTNKTDNCSRDNHVLLPTNILRYADLSWFNTLWRHDGWLENTQALTKSKIEDIVPVVMPYVRGSRPISGGLQWINASHVFGIANINNCHWVFFDISLEQQVITVYNSVAQDWDFVLAHFENVRKNLPIICGMGGMWEHSKLPRKPLNYVWDVVEYPNPPRQLNEHDCGVMALKYMECTAFGVPVTKLMAKRCDKFRRRYCAKLFELSEEQKRNSSE
ncbi:uncharacterized protein LOC131019007 isoform X2 [Salvia miltiorrhiza]|uniref:uncharacterized protein LOC131019007 isoform X2 n=1 Tax=Salvia miltiorrhiza TaxID=226208 RepID=UPI0025AD8FA7|nr:uncharacterized protein LOC131019007 isoform X2 [Salvia miltiorrhiza]